MIVIQNKKDYENKLWKLLEDKSKFNCLENDPTIDGENKLINFLLRLKNNRVISEARNKTL